MRGGGGWMGVWGGAHAHAHAHVSKHACVCTYEIIGNPWDSPNLMVAAICN